MTTTVSVIDDDITRVPADALITTINSGGMWFGGIDAAIQRVAINMFHGQAADMRPIQDGDALFATSTSPHQGAFQNVIFVVDDLGYDLSDIVLAGLELAVDNELESVSIPTLRTGVMAGVRETREEALTALINTVKFVASGTPLKHITVVAYNNPADLAFLQAALN